MQEERQSRALLIDSAGYDVRETMISGLADLQKAVGGYIEIAYQWPNGDMLFVDEEGLLKPQQGYFYISVRPEQVLAGNGVIVGREVVEGNADVGLTVTEVLAMITFGKPRRFATPRQFR